MKCFECKKKRIKTDSGTCLICKPRIHGKEFKRKIIDWGKHGGTEVKSKKGSIKRGYADNSWMDTKSFW